VALANVCKVCTALDTLPEAQADELDGMLADTGWIERSIANAVTAAGQPVSRSSVSRHIRGKCDLGITYRTRAA
jgi:hypothetical protein